MPAHDNLTWKCAEGIKGNLYGFDPGENIEISRQRYAKRDCGIKLFNRLVKIHVSKEDIPKIKNISNLNSSADWLKISYTNNFNELSFPDTLNEPWPHLQLEYSKIPDNFKDDIKITGELIDQDGKKGEINTILKITHITREVHDKWKNPEASPVLVNFEPSYYIFAIEGKSNKDLYQWKCPNGIIGNIEGVEYQENNETSIGRKAKIGCGLIPHTGLLPLSWSNEDLMSERKFIDKKPIYIDDIKTIYGYKVVQVPGYDGKDTSGIKFDRLPFNSGCNWTIPIKITDKLDRDNVEDFKFNFCPWHLKEQTFDNWKYKGD